MSIISLISGLIGPLIKFVLLALWEMKEKSHEAVEAKPDPDLYDRLDRYQRM